MVQSLAYRLATPPTQLRVRCVLPSRHTHIRAANACYLLCFGGGVALAYMADVVEQLTASDQANIEAAMQLALNQTLN